MKRVYRLDLVVPFLAVLLAAIVFGYASPSRSASAPEGAQAMVQSLSDRATGLLEDPGSSPEKRAELFRELLREYFASAAIGKWVLGRYWRQATEAEQQEYLQLFEDYVVYGYVKRFGAYSGEQLRIIKAAKIDDRSVTVFSEFVSAGGDKPIKVDWRVGYKGDTYKITDVMVEGTSLSQTLRSDFASTIHQNGGRIAGLLEVLREKVSVLKSDLGINT